MFWYKEANYIVEGGYKSLLDCIIKDSFHNITQNDGCIINNAKVLSVNAGGKDCHIQWKNMISNKIFNIIANKVIFAITINQLMQIDIFPQLDFYSQHIHSHQYLRIYTLHDSLEKVPDVLLTVGPLRKSIVYSRKNGFKK